MKSSLRILIGRTALSLAFSFLLAVFSNADAVSFKALENLTSSISSEANNISIDGSAIVGASGGQAVVWTDSGAFGLGYLPGYGSSQALGIEPNFSEYSNIDSIVGTAYSSSGVEQAFLWSQGTGIVGLGFLTGDDNSRAYGTSGATIVGTSFNSSGSYKAFRWTQSEGMVNIGTGIATGVSFRGGVVVGQSNNEAFRWTESTGIIGLGDLPGGNFNSSATAVTSDGSVVVGYGETSEGRHAFRWTQSGGMVDIANLPGYSEAHAASWDGSTVVGMVNARQYPYEFEAFIWDEVNGMRYLKDVLTGEYDLNLTGWHLEDARGISDNGTIIVYLFRGSTARLTH